MQESVSANISSTSILDSFPEGVLWACPVFKDSSIIDFEIGYTNKKAEELINHPAGTLMGLRILRDGIPSAEDAEGNFQSYLEVYQTGQTREISLYVPYSGQTNIIARSRHENGVLNVTRDRKAQQAAEQKEQAKARLLDTIVNSAPIGIVAYETIRNEKGEIVDFRSKLYNNVLHLLTGISQHERGSLTFGELMKVLNVKDAFDLHKRTVETGEPFSMEYFSPRLTSWLHHFAVKLEDGFLIMISDITAIKTTQQELHQQSQFLTTVFNTSTNAIVVLEALRGENGQIRDFRYKQVNKKFVGLLRKAEEEIVGGTMLTVFPNTQRTGIFDMYKQVIENGVPRQIELHYDDENINAWFDFSIMRLDSNTAVGSFYDITARKAAFSELEQQKNLLHNILKYSSNGISVSETIKDEEGKVTDMRTVLANDAAVRFTSLDKKIYLSKTASEIDPNFIYSSYFQRCLHALETGESFITQYFLEITSKWLEVTVSKMDKEHLIHIFTDVTSMKEVQLHMERSSKQLQTIINRTQSGIFTAVPVKNEKGDVVDFRFVIVNRTLARYVHQQPEALAGELGSKWFTGYKNSGLFELFCETLLTGKTNRFDYHYNADKIDAWIDMMCSKFEDEVLVTFNDYTPVKKLQLELQKMVEELKSSNASLEQFAYVASHDLQQPLRKIKTFSDRLKLSLLPQLDDNQRKMFNRIDTSVIRMMHLIRDLLAFSQLTAKPEFDEVDLNKVVEEAIHDLDTTIEETDAKIDIAILPQIFGSEQQLRQLFQNVIGNAIKYRKSGIAPQVRITCNIIEAKSLTGIIEAEGGKGKYCVIEVSDNGIGFEQKYADKIFQVFQRLHGISEYEGTGVGLAIVQKVVMNHHGNISVKSEPEIGTTFTIELPV